ncbi:uncharacterized protein FIBRA_03154 [Fibroporia radiculosa]|uniref:Uncharacterized protein n=1 Tax=Fibroporia radiculosa TaxID=599839 RepID=J4I9G2_9APHY|nr:uncharacterized protein FIBRA_03154 [Fibroporia radiculosa]CCM01106.1 predicted protein [Fibroporia radiculosa]
MADHQAWERDAEKIAHGGSGPLSGSESTAQCLRKSPRAPSRALPTAAKAPLPRGHGQASVDGGSEGAVPVAWHGRGRPSFPICALPTCRIPPLSPVAAQNGRGQVFQAAQLSNWLQAHGEMCMGVWLEDCSGERMSGGPAEGCCPTAAQGTGRVYTHENVRRVIGCWKREGSADISGLSPQLGRPA